MGFFRRTSNLMTDKAAEAAATTEPERDDGPPPYSAIAGGSPAVSSQQHTGAPAAATIGELEIQHPHAGAVVITRRVPCDRALYVHADRVASCSLIVEHGADADNCDMAIVWVEFSGGSADISDSCGASIRPNDNNEYEVYALGKRGASLGGSALECRVIVQMPAVASVHHPGIRAVLCNDHIGLGNLANVFFEHIDISAANASVSLAQIGAGRIVVKTECSPIDARCVVAQGSITLETWGAPVNAVGLRAAEMRIKTAKAEISLKHSTGGTVTAETINGRIWLKEVTAGDLRASTTNHAIKGTPVTADTLRLTTTNAKIAGTWHVRDLMDASTANSRIDCSIGLLDPAARTVIALATANAWIRAVLLGDVFRGRFDLKTTSSPVSLTRVVDGQGADDPPESLVVDTKSYKRGTIGTPQELRHNLTARTTEAPIQVKFDTDI